MAYAIGIGKTLDKEINKMKNTLPLSIAMVIVGAVTLAPLFNFVIETFKAVTLALG